jgi:acetyl esterase/lipase
MGLYALPVALLWLAPAAAAQAAPAVPDGWVVESDISYGPYQQNVLDIVRPREAGRQRRPGVIVIHGGGWVRGDKESRLPVCLRYVEQGFVCAIVAYRLADAAPAPAAITDVLEATKWFFRNTGRYRVDRKRIVVTGDSAGGHLALMAGMVDRKAKLGPRSKLKAVVNFYGITDVGDQVDGPNEREFASKWLPEQDGRYALSRRVSPMTYARKDVPPILTIHGDADEVVPYEHGVRLTKAIRDAGGKAELIVVPYGGHGFEKEALDRIYEREIWPFLTKHGVIR